MTKNCCAVLQEFNLVNLPPTNLLVKTRKFHVKCMFVLSGSYVSLFWVTFILTGSYVCLIWVTRLSYLGHMLVLSAMSTTRWRSLTLTNVDVDDEGRMTSPGGSQCLIWVMFIIAGSHVSLIWVTCLSYLDHLFVLFGSHVCLI